MHKSERTVARVIEAFSTSPGQYESVHNPIKLADYLKITSGSVIIAFAVECAVHSADDKYKLYSIQGTNTGPATTDRKLLATVTKLRDSKSFQTRRVEVFQKRDNGTDRLCLSAVVDFHLPEQGFREDYSLKPSMEYTHYSKLKDWEEQMKDDVEAGTLEEEVMEFVIEAYDEQLRPLYRAKWCPESIIRHNIGGIKKEWSHSQEKLPLAQRTSADWVKSKPVLNSRREQLTSLAFLTDIVNTVLPLTHDHLSFDDVANFVTLDFAVHLYKDDFDLNRWHLREMKTPAGAHARHLHTMDIWDEHGNLVACATQTALLRPKL